MRLWSKVRCPSDSISRIPKKLIDTLRPALPEGSTFLSVEHFGTSAWTITGRLLAQNADGTEANYFLKVLSILLENTQITSYAIYSLLAGCFRRSRYGHAEGRIRVIESDLESHERLSPKALWVRPV